MYGATTDGNFQLTHSLTTKPQPLNVSSDTVAKDGEIRVVLTNTWPLTAIQCDRIVINMHQGTGKADLSENLANLTVVTRPNSGPQGWKLAEDNKQGTLAFEPTGNTKKIAAGDSLAITISGFTVNKEVAATSVKITRRADDADQGHVTYGVGKWPTDFFVGNFRAESPVVNYQEGTTLYWNGSTDATYIIKRNGKQETRQPHDHGSYSTDHLTRNTTFTLVTKHQQIAEAPYYLDTTILVNGADQEITHATIEQLTIAKSLKVKGTVDLMTKTSWVDLGGEKKSEFILHTETDGLLYLFNYQLNADNLASKPPRLSVFPGKNGNLLQSVPLAYVKDAGDGLVAHNVFVPRGTLYFTGSQPKADEDPEPMIPPAVLFVPFGAGAIKKGKMPAQV